MKAEPTDLDYQRGQAAARKSIDAIERAAASLRDPVNADVAKVRAELERHDREARAITVPQFGLGWLTVTGERYNTLLRIRLAMEHRE